MKKIIFVCASSIIAMCSCNSGGENSSTTSDTSTTTMDTSTGMHDANGNMNAASGNMSDTATNAANMNSGASAGTMNAGTMDAATTAFVTKAASADMMEIEMGNMAKQKAQSQRVKDYAAMLVNDHTNSSNQLKSMTGAAMNMSDMQMPADHKKHMDMMQNKTGAEFDKQYMQMMVADHKKNIDEFKKASTTVKNDAVKNFATSTLPVLQKHLDSAQAISKKM